MESSGSHRSPEPAPRRASLSGRAFRGRVSSACSSCRRRKIRCTGNQPCQHCSEHHLECVFDRRVRSAAPVGPAESQVFTWPPGPTLGAETPSPDQHVPFEYQNLVPEAAWDKQSGLMPNPGLTSSLPFETPIESLSNGAAPIQPQHGFLEQGHEGPPPEDAYRLLSKAANGPVSVLGPQWPTEDRALALLQTFLDHLGTVQHHVDPRDFTKRTALLYSDLGARGTSSGVFYLTFLLVMAIGELLQGSSEGNEELPGARYYQEALNRLPGFSALRNYGVVAVEIMSLIAFYLQCADSKEDAYVYAGVGLRLAISNRMARQEEENKSYEATHRNRLWWTIYVQERRLAAATGNPVGVADSAITTPPPFDNSSFASSSALRVNVELGWITGSITRDIYGRRHNSEREFVIQLQTILASLSLVHKGILQDHLAGPLGISRTSATLYLTLFQSIMLVLRPALLLMAKSKIQEGNAQMQGQSAEGTTLEVFYRPCVHAARQALSIVEYVNRQEVLAKFGFTHLDALFSAAFVFVMAEVSGIGASTEPELQRAIIQLRHLAGSGNKVAAKRLTDIGHMCAVLEIQPDGSGSDPHSAEGLDARSAWSEVGNFFAGSLDPSGFGENQLDFSVHGLGLDGTVATEWEQLETAACLFKAAGEHNWAGV